MRVCLFVLCAGFAITLQAASHKTIYVDVNAAPGGNGSANKPFNTIAAAMTLAHSAGGDPTIKVSPGIYQFDSQITIDIPMDLVGSDILEIDSSGLPTGVVVPGTETRIVGSAALGASPLVSVGRTDGVVVDDVNIRNITFDAGPGGGDDIDLNQVQNFSVSQNVLTGPPTVTTTNQGIGPVASSGLIIGNYITGVGCGACIRAGYPGSPAFVTVIGNRSVLNRNAALLFGGATYGITEHGDQLDALVTGNDLSGTTGSNSTGLRFFVIRKELPDTQSDGNINALVVGNRIVGNSVGIAMDVGFPYRQVAYPTPTSPLVCDTRVYTGNLNVTLLGNTLSGSLVTDGLISFTRNTATLKPQQQMSWQYLHNATYSIIDPQGTLAAALKDNPTTDPFVGGLCAADTTHEILNNKLIYNGAIVQ